MTHDTIYLAIPIIIIAWILFVLYAKKNLPKIKVERLVGKNGTNTVLVAKVDPTTRYPIAVLCQEVFEAQWKVHPTRLLFNHAKKQIRERELRGHEIEVQAARLLKLYDKGDNESIHRMREARALKTMYKGFEKLTEEQIYQKMLDHKQMAVSWVREHGERLNIEYENAINR